MAPRSRRSKKLSPAAKSAIAIGLGVAAVGTVAFVLTRPSAAATTPPGPGPGPTPFGTLTVLGSAPITVRSAPGASSPVVGTIPGGAQVSQDSTGVDSGGNTATIGSDTWFHVTDIHNVGSPPGVAGFASLENAAGAIQLSSP